MPRMPLGAAPPAGWPVRIYFAVLAAIVLVLTVSTLPGVRSRPGVVPVYDDWIQPAGYVLAAGAVVWRVVRYAELRLLWSLVALALTLRAAGFLHLIFILDRRPAYPSLADLFWVLSALVLLAALLVVAHGFAPRSSRTLGLDALVGAFTAAAVAGVLLQGTLDRLTVPGAPRDVVATNLAYPALDVALLVVVATLVSATHGRLPWAAGTACAGVLAFAVVDSVYLYQATTGTFRPGSFLTPLSLAGSMVIAGSAWLPTRGARLPHPDRPASLVLPAVLALLSVVVGSYNAVTGTSPVVIAFAAGSVTLAILRGFLTFRGDREESSAAIAGKEEEVERFQALVEASEDFIAIATFDGRLTYLNPAGRRLVGLADDVDIRQTSVADYAPDLRARDLVAGRPGLAEFGTWRGDSELIDHRGGAPIPVTANTFVLRHPHTGTPWLMATVQRDVTGLRAAQAALQRLADERRVLLGHLIEAQEAERARIAADVHDDSVQALAAVDLRIGLLQRRSADADPEVREAIREVQEAVGHAMARLRHLLFDLDSPAQRADLVTALKEAASTIFGDGVRWHVDANGEVDLPETQRVITYRMAKEAMINARKHAVATTISVDVRAVGEGVELIVTDDGVGFDTTAVEKRMGHRGLADMRDRAASAGGWIRLEQPECGGTTVRIWMPSAEPA